jgi:LysM repeat protein
MRKTGVALLLLVAFIVGVVFLTLDFGGGKSKVSSRPTNTTVTTTGGTTTTTRAEVKYTVMPGDTLISISEKFGVTQRQIIDANQIANPDNLVAGQVLVIPPETVVRLIVRPRKAVPGETIELTLEGAQPGEYITFEIHKPNGTTFTGAPHYTGDDTISTTYTLGASDPVGAYTAVARGDQITRAEKAFQVVAPPTPTTVG